MEGMGISGLQQLVEGSNLPESDKDIWLITLEMMDDEQAQAILDSVADDPQELETLTRNMKMKQVAFANGDDALLSQVLEDEKEELARA